MKILKYPTLVTVQVIYYRPRSSILQEFIWQAEDILPEHPRISKFLRFWKDEIDAIIHQVLIAETNSNFRPISLEKVFGVR
jgi:uncharacterized protein Usg